MQKLDHHDSQISLIQTLQTKFPRHRRPRYEIEPHEPTYKPTNLKQNLSRRLKFQYFGYLQKMSAEQEVAQVSQILKTSSKVAEKFIFWLSGGEITNAKMFLHFSEQIKKMDCLKIFDFYCYGSEDLTDQTWKNIALGLKSLKSLQHLKIKLDLCIEVHDKSIEYLAKALRKLISLQTLDLSFDQGGMVTDQGIRVLWESIKHLRNLQTLSISFYYCGALCWNEIGDPAEGLKRLKFLKNFKLNCALMEQMESEGIKKISKMVGAIKSLEEIYLRLFECNMEDKEVKVLMKGFKGKEYLKKIDLDIGRNAITDEGLISISESFQGLKVVEEIIIRMQECKKITEEGREMLKKELEKIGSLKKLEIIWQ